MALTRIKGQSLQNLSPDLAKKIHSLSPRQMDALRFTSQLITSFPEGIPLTMLAEHLRITVPAASVLVNTLVKAGMIERTQNPNDRRFVCISLSGMGTEIINETVAYMDEIISELMEPFSPEERKILAKAGHILYQYAYPGLKEKHQNAHSPD